MTRPGRARWRTSDFGFSAGGLGPPWGRGGGSGTVEGSAGGGGWSCGSASCLPSATSPRALGFSKSPLAEPSKRLQIL